MCESGTGSSDPFRDGLREQQFRGVGGSGGDRRESLSLDAALSTETDDKLAKRQVSLIFNMDVRVLMHPTSNMRMIVDQFGRVVNGELRKGDTTISLAKFESSNIVTSSLDSLVNLVRNLDSSERHSSCFQVA